MSSDRPYRFSTLCLFFSILWLGTSFQAFSQEPHYWVTFTDKTGTPYSIDEPEAFLSEAAIQRREKAGIPIDKTDLPVDPAYRDSILAHPDVEFLHSSKWFNAITVHCTDSLHMDTIDQWSFVRSRERVKHLGIPAPYRPEEVEAETEKANAAPKWHAEHSDPGKAARQLSMLGLDALFDAGHRGKGIRIAVLDAGFPMVNEMEAFSHLFEEGRYLGGFDAVKGDRYPFRSFSHGRSVLSILAAKKEGGILGSAPEASYFLCRTENVASEYRIEENNWVAAAEFADSAGADILSTSLGYSTFDDSTQNYSPSDLDGNSTRITRAADIAASKGMLVVNSAGNYAQSSWGALGAPADGDSVMAVGAVNADEEIAPFSSRGPTADGRIKPDVCAMGQGTAFLGGDGEVRRGNGTSFSAPLISGGAACLWSAHPKLTAMELYKVILDHASHPKAPNNKVGFGIPDFFKAYLNLKGVKEADGGKARLLSYGPNPYEDRIELQLFSGASERLRITWYDLLGRVLRQESRRLIEGQHHEITLHPPSIPGSSGLHFLKIDWENGPSRELKLMGAGLDR